MPLGYQIILSANNQDCNVRSMIIPCQTLKIEDRDVDKVPNIPYDTTDLQSSSSSHTEYIQSFSIDNMSYLSYLGLMKFVVLIFQIYSYILQGLISYRSIVIII
ncbi:hypothetical protein [Orientia tsutsugamushi]|uniref:Uncharacterized protein n=1 Tax=Orientia tsutsugamushi str. TA716 TaxID=1359175 RepID=A0A0F3NSG0_ORITS|nr:hypothetical protein [Orientia tsutsugamushi]KJV70686.1 hypothetical protein OTSTA716_2500 [Orientia tsutsugamushi str. TA716]